MSESRFGSTSPAAMAKYSREKAQRAKEIRETIEMKHAGWSYRQIAEHHGVSVATVMNRYKKGLAKYIPAEVVEQERKAVLDRWSQMLRSDLELMAQMKRDGNLTGYVQLHNAVLAIDDRMITVLGLQAPKTLVIQEEKIEATPQETEMTKLLRAAQEANEARRAKMGAPAREESAA